MCHVLNRNGCLLWTCPALSTAICQVPRTIAVLLHSTNCQAKKCVCVNRFFWWKYALGWAEVFLMSACFLGTFNACMFPCRSFGSIFVGKGRYDMPVPFLTDLVCTIFDHVWFKFARFYEAFLTEMSKQPSLNMPQKGKQVLKKVLTVRLKWLSMTALLLHFLSSYVQLSRNSANSSAAAQRRWNLCCWWQQLWPWKWFLNKHVRITLDTKHKKRTN